MMGITHFRLNPFTKNPLIKILLQKSYFINYDVLVMSTFNGKVFLFVIIYVFFWLNIFLQWYNSKNIILTLMIAAVP